MIRPVIPSDNIFSECYLITIKNELDDTKKDLFVLEQFQFDTKTTEEKEFVNQVLNTTVKNQDKNYPFGGIALNLAFITVCNFIIFNFEIKNLKIFLLKRILIL